MKSHLFWRTSLGSVGVFALGIALLAGSGCGKSNAGPDASVERSSPTADSTSRPLAASPESTPAELAFNDAEASADRRSDWPNWRGPDGRAIAVRPQLAANWPKTDPQPRWSAKLGIGWSSPAVAENRLFVTDRQGNAERLLAFDATTGQLLWETANPVDFDPHAVGRRHGNGPKSTPAVNNGRVFSLGIAGWLQAVDVASGKVIWHVNLPEKFGQHQPLPGERAVVEGAEHVVVPIGKGLGAPVPLFGYTGSLLVADKLVILSVGGVRGGTIMAFDAAHGEVVWSALNEHVSYSSPVLAVMHGIPQVVAMTGPRVVGLRLEDGKLLWSHPFQIQYDESISTPAIGDNQVFVTGDGRPLTALAIPANLSPERPARARVAWECRELSSYLSSMVVAAGHLWGMGDDGAFSCVRISDGKTLWTDGNHGTYCSPILAGNRLLGLNEDGELAVLSATPSAYQAIGLVRVADEATWTMPAVVSNRVYIRSASAIAAFEFGE